MNITNKCDALKITKIEYRIFKGYDDREKMGLRYGLKNTGDKDLKLDIKVYPKDTEGHHIGESSYGPSKLKAHYEHPFSDISYYAVGENMSSFSGKADFVLTCEKEGAPKKEKAGGKGGLKFFISEERLSRIKKATGAESEIEVRMELALLLELMIKEGGTKGIVEKLKK